MTHAEPATTSPAFRLGRWCVYATALVPVVVLPGFLFPFVTLRGVYFRVLVEVAVACVAYLALRRETVLRFRDPILLALAAFVAISVVAAAFGASWMRSFFGDYERMGGVWTWLHLLGFYVAARAFLDRSSFFHYARAVVVVALAVCAFGLARSYGLRAPIGIGGPSAGITLGNNGLLAGYLLLAGGCAAAVALWGSGRRWPYAAAIAAIVYVMSQTGNRSSFVALAVAGVVVGAGLAAHNVARLRSNRGRALFAATAVVLIAGAVLVAARPSLLRATGVPSLERLSTGVDSSRVLQWNAALSGVRDRPILGVGPENYHLVWDEHYQPEMARLVGDARWDRAHNVFLESLATTGIVGFVALVAVFVTAVSVPVRAARRGALPFPAALAFIATTVAYGVYLFFWFFDLTAVVVWLALLAGASTTTHPLLEFGAVRAHRRQTTIVLAGGALALAASLFIYGYETLRVARALGRTVDVERAVPDVLADFETAFTSPAPSTHHAFQLFTGYLRTLGPRLEGVRADPDAARAMDRAFALAWSAINREVQLDPVSERTLSHRARVALAAAVYYGNAELRESAVADFANAVALAPRRIPSYYNLARVLVANGAPDAAITVLHRALTVAPDDGRTHIEMAKAQLAARRESDAAAFVQSAIRHGTKPPAELVASVVRRLDGAGFRAQAESLAFAYAHSAAGPLFVPELPDATAARAQLEILGALSRLASMRGDTARANAARQASATVCAFQNPLPDAYAATGRDPGWSAPLNGANLELRGACADVSPRAQTG